jgi:serine/threonine protein kinase
MGAIYKATDQNLKITVALKHTLYQNDYIYRVFKREDRILAALRHPALPRVTDYFTTPRGQFLVMGFIAGADLGTLLNRRSKPFSMDEALDWADQLLDALEYLHGRTPVVLHRDIKPQNIKITAKGELILLDFGLAKGTTLETSKGSFNSIYGYTPQYAPLEQIRASGTDPRSDLYSFAATLYHLLTKTPPINALERADQVLNHRVDPLCPIHELNPTVAPGISRILHQTMSLATDERPPTAAALRAALGAVRRGEPWMAFASLPLVGNDIAAPRIDVPITESPIAPPDAMYTVITPDATTLIPGATTQPIAATGRSASTNGATPLAQRHRLRPWALGLIALLLLGLLGGGSSLAAFLARDAGLPIGLQPSTIIASSVSVTPSPSRTATPRSTNTVTPTTPSPTTTPTSSPTTTASSTPTTLAPAPVSFTATPKPALRMPNLVAYGENQAKEILSELGIDAERISVIYQSRDILGDQFDQFPAYAVVAT